MSNVCKKDHSVFSFLFPIPTATVRPPPAPAPPLIPVTISDTEADRFRVAFGSALRNPAFKKVVRRLLHRENMESLAAACPGLQDDLVAQAFLTVPYASVLL